MRPNSRCRHVDFRLENAGRRHRFGLRAVPPEKIAFPLDLRGDFTGRTVADLAQWNGQLFAQLDYTDIAAWRRWVQFPVSFPHGVGAVRVWGGLKNGELAEITADVQLSQVKTRLGKDLPELELDALQGRVGWKQLDDGFEVSSFQARPDDTRRHAAADGFAAALPSRRRARSRRAANCGSTRLISGRS